MRLWLFIGVIGGPLVFGGVIAACGLEIAGSGTVDGGPAGDAHGEGIDVDDPDQADLDAGDAADSTAPLPLVTIAYAHSPDTLYKIDIVTNRLTLVAPFTGDCESGGILDLAIDAMGNAYVTTSSTLYRLDLATAACTKIAEGSYPNSLGFVRRGDGGAEELVGYAGSSYRRIDTTTGGVMVIGALDGGYTSSGDVVEMPDAGAFLAVNGAGCLDCLVQVDPSTGDIIKNLGTVNHSKVYGVAAYGSLIYGFTGSGIMFSMERVDGGVVTADIDAGGPDAGPASFYGAASALIPGGGR